MRDILWASLLAAVLIVGCSICSLYALQQVDRIHEEKCQTLGKEWHYVDGYKTPDLCANKEGRQVYFDLVGK